MADEELKKKCTERAKIFQQAMESCHSSSPIDCIEWFADRIAELEDKLANADYQLEGRDNEIAELEQENKVLAQNLEDTDIVNKALEKENAELSNRNQELLESCEGATMMYKDLCKAKEIIQKLIANAPNTYSGTDVELQQKKMFSFQDAANKAEQFLSEVDK